MRRVLLAFFVLAAMTLSACEETDRVKVIVPYGSPMLALVTLIEDQDRYDVDVVMGADALVAAFASNSHDVIVAPTQLGARFHRGEEDHALLATVVWGNLAICSIDTPIDTFASLDGKSLTVFGENQVPDIIIRALIEDMGLDVDLDYVDSLSTAVAMLSHDPGLVILAAEPSVSMLKANHPALHTVDVQDAFQAMTGRHSFPQSSVFVRPEMTNDAVSLLLEDIMTSVQDASDDPQSYAIRAARAGMTMDVQEIASAIPGSNLSVVLSTEAKDDVVYLLDLIMDVNPDLLGGAKPPETFFHSGAVT
jgi:NitT/TauT family transport system substrate-binding protein